MKLKLFLPVLLVLAYSCDQKVEINAEHMSGKWQASEFESEIPNMSAEYKEAGEKEFLSSVYTLNEDYSMEMRSEYFKEGARGHWELDPVTNEISMIYSYDTIEGLEKYTIKYLSKKKVILRQDIDANEFKGFVELTLEK